LTGAEGYGLTSAEYLLIKRLALLVAVVASLAAAAEGPAGGIADQPCMNVAGENTNTCPAGALGIPYSVRFVEVEGSGCGPGEQTFHLDSGLLPPELALATDGTLSGIPTQAGTFQFYVEMREPQDDPANCAGKRTQKQFTLKVCNQLGIVSSPALPRLAEVRVPFRTTLSWCGGTGRLAWTVSAGELPPGLALRPDGSMAGAPRVAGTYRFNARATDVHGRAATYSGTISVTRSLRLRAQNVPAARVGRTYRAELRAIGGVAPKFWTIERGRLPRGLRLDATRGVLVGTPRMSGTHRITVEARDRLDVTARATFTIVVLASSRPGPIGVARQFGPPASSSRSSIGR
jgi:large repetitive protein